jgi:hypothetical protein
MAIKIIFFFLFLLIQALLGMTDAPDLTERAIAFETLGYIGESLEGKAALAELGNPFTHCLDKLGQLMRDGLTETRIRGMCAFAALLQLEKENQTGELVSLTECWYRRTLGDGGQPMSVLAGMAKLPFPDLRLAAFMVLRRVAEQVGPEGMGNGIGPLFRIRMFWAFWIHIRIRYLFVWIRILPSTSKKI